MKSAGKGPRVAEGSEGHSAVAVKLKGAYRRIEDGLLVRRGNLDEVLNDGHGECLHHSASSRRAPLPG